VQNWTQKPDDRYAGGGEKTTERVEILSGSEEASEAVKYRGLAEADRSVFDAAFGLSRFSLQADFIFVSAPRKVKAHRIISPF